MCLLLLLLHYLSQEELLRLDSCCASSRIFSMSPLWMEEDEGTCSSPPTIPSSSSTTWAKAGVPGGAAACDASGELPFSSSSTHEPADGGDGKTERTISYGPV